MQTPRPARPTGITILAVLAAIGGVVLLLGGLAALVGGAIVGSVFGGLGFVFTLIGLVALATGVAELAFAYGAWTLQPWAWTVGVAVSIVNLVIDLLYVIGGVSIFSEIIGIVVALIILYYLDTPDIRRVFSKPTTSIVQSFQNRR